MPPKYTCGIENIYSEIHRVQFYWYLSVHTPVSTCQVYNNKTGLIHTSNGGAFVCTLRACIQHLLTLFEVSARAFSQCSIICEKKLLNAQRRAQRKWNQPVQTEMGLRSVIPMARCASELWKCDESGQALRYVATELNTECVLFDFKSSCS